MTDIARKHGSTYSSEGEARQHYKGTARPLSADDWRNPPEYTHIMRAFIGLTLPVLLHDITFSDRTAYV